jgi:hypothetical protein
MIYDEFEDQCIAMSTPSLSVKVRDIFNDADISLMSFSGTQKQIDDEKFRLNESAQKEAQIVSCEHIVKVQAIYDAFKQALALEYGTKIESINDLIYSKSYDAGHSGGMVSVEEQYASTAEVIHDVMEVLKTKVNLENLV